MDDIKLLVTLDENYLPHLQVLLTSIHASNPGERMTLYLVHSGIPKEKLSTLEAQCALCGMELRPVTVDSKLFEGAPVTKQYPQEMYYRLLAAQLLPEGLHRVLYLDPDTLVEAASSVAPSTETVADYEAGWLPGGFSWFETNTSGGAAETTWMGEDGDSNITLTCSAGPLLLPEGTGETVRFGGVTAAIGPNVDKMADLLPNSGNLVSILVFGGCGVLFILLGNYMPRIKQNYTFGCKTPWALNDEHNWNRTQRMGGIVFVVIGVVFMVAIPFSRVLGETGMLILLLGSSLGGTLWIYLYSYLVYIGKMK